MVLKALHLMKCYTQCNMILQRAGIVEIWITSDYLN